MTVKKPDSKAIKTIHEITHEHETLVRAISCDFVDRVYANSHLLGVGVNPTTAGR